MTIEEKINIEVEIYKNIFIQSIASSEMILAAQPNMNQNHIKYIAEAKQELELMKETEVSYTGWPYFEDVEYLDRNEYKEMLSKLSFSSGIHPPEKVYFSLNKLSYLKIEMEYISKKTDRHSTRDKKPPIQSLEKVLMYLDDDDPSIKALIDLYVSFGGDLQNIKSYKKKVLFRVSKAKSISSPSLSSDKLKKIKKEYKKIKNQLLDNPSSIIKNFAKPAIKLLNL